MDFFTIRFKTDDAESENRFTKYLHEAISSLHIEQPHIQISGLADGMVECVIGLSDIVDLNMRERQIDLLSLGLARYVVDVKEEKLIRRIMSREYRWSSAEEQEQVAGICRNMLSGSNDYDTSSVKKERISLIYEALREYLHSSHFIHLEGFLAFRIKGYEALLRETIDFAVDEYLLDKQYEEFISLLQYFVYFQEPLTPLVHLMHKQDHEFAILNEQFTPVNTSSSGVVARIADQEMEMEDVIVSTLISLSPDRILIHTLDPKAKVIETIRRIFGERVEICLLCPHCKSFHRQVRHLDQR